jgi:hypothetical protein
MKLLASIALMTLAGSVVAMAEGMPIQGAFAVAYTGRANTGGVSYCDPSGTILPIAVEAHGDGFTSLGGLSFYLQKGIGFDGTLHGCLTLTAPNGDTLTAVYTGTEGGTNSNNFTPAAGTLVFTGGTGRFKSATGSAKFTATFATFYPELTILAGASAPAQGMAFYLFEGTLLFPARD